MHSPFVYAFIRQVLNDRKKYPAYEVVEGLRSGLKKDQRVLTVEDMGAGSVNMKNKERAVKTIARHSLKPARFGKLLYRMARYYQPASIVELGTSLGITTCYLAMGAADRPVITLEGAPAVARVAQEQFEKAGLTNISLRPGNFDTSFPAVLQELPETAFVFVDGNHRKAPTLRYFEAALQKAGNDTMLIFDDIHWSREMEEAWAIIKSHPSVQCTIDLFFIGIVLFRREFHEPRHFTIRF